MIDADVGQADVTVDGVKRGTTPISIDGLPVGTHKVLVQKPPAKDWEQVVQLAAGTTLVHAEMSASMPKAPTEGMLDIKADAVNAEVLIDGIAFGKTPLLTKIASGDHWIQVKLEGHITFEQ